MPLEAVHLKKLLCFFDAPPAQRKAMLRDNIRREIAKANGVTGSGGDFHVPFWADAKGHVFGKVDLEDQTEIRIASNERRKNLYPQLTTGFLKWWNEKRRWKDEDFEREPDIAPAKYSISEDARAKVEGILALKVGDGSHRIIYPYVSENPTLSEEGARLGLWALSQALPYYDLADFRVFDVLRSKSWGVADCPLRGDEGAIFAARHEDLVSGWLALREEYAPGTNEKMNLGSAWESRAKTALANARSACTTTPSPTDQNPSALPSAPHGSSPPTMGPGAAHAPRRPGRSRRGRGGAGGRPGRRAGGFAAIGRDELSGQADRAHGDGGDARATTPCVIP